MEEFKVDPSIAYDVVELPSRGIHYKNNKKSVRIAYLTAADENILASPNLIQTNEIVNELLRRKILDRDITIEEIVEEDKQAILIFLRNTAFGSEYYIKLKDPVTQEDFVTVVDLSSIDFKDFTLTTDSNGEYPYHMEKSNADITFKFLSQKDENLLMELGKSYKGPSVAPVITKQLELMIKSVNGNREQMNIYNYIQNLPIRDSQEFRKYIQKNKPGLELTRKAKSPSGEEVEFTVAFGVDFFRPFYGL